MKDARIALILSVLRAPEYDARFAALDVTAWPVGPRHLAETLADMVRAGALRGPGIDPARALAESSGISFAAIADLVPHTAYRPRDPETIENLFRLVTGVDGVPMGELAVRQAERHRITTPPRRPPPIDPADLAVVIERVRTPEDLLILAREALEAEDWPLVEFATRCAEEIVARAEARRASGGAA
jgi:hypothetical protein